jgi:hypothetical protein
MIAAPLTAARAKTRSRAAVAFVVCLAGIAVCRPTAAQDRADDAIDRVRASDHDDEEAATSTSKSKALSQAQLEGLLAKYAREPKVEEVVAATLRAERHNPRHFAELASRSRLRGLIPHLDLGARRGQGIDLRWTLADDLADHRTTADDVMLFATLRFDLDRLLFAGEEVSIAREARFTREASRELIRQVVHVYFLRRRLQLERDLQDGGSIAAQLRIDEAEAILNAFTDGAFRRMLSTH